MKNNLLFTLLLFAGSLLAQPVKFDYKKDVTFLKTGSTDTLSAAFVGGLNSPQFSDIDLDGDGIMDLFVFERQGNKVLTYLRKNNKYVYEPKYEAMFPPLNNWVVLRDYNCDGKMDIFTEVNYNARPDTTRYIYSNGIRVIKNVTTTPGQLKWFQKDNQLWDIGTPPSNPPVNIDMGNIDLPAIEDIDNDGDLDILNMPLGKNVIRFYKNLSKERGYNCDSLIFSFRDECWGYVSFKITSNSFVLNDPSPCARFYKTAMHNGTTLCLYDKDNDGDKDLLYGDISFGSLVMLENGKTLNTKTKIDSIISQDTLFPKGSVQAAMELFPAAYMYDFDGDGKRDMVVTPNAETGSKNNNQIFFYKNTSTTASPNFVYQRNNFLVDEMVDLGGNSYPNFVDIDGDKDLDLMLTTQGEFTQTRGTNDRLVWYKNVGNSITPVYQLADTNFMQINSGANKINKMVVSFGDLNGDAKPDMLIGDLNGKMHYFQNTTTGSNISFNRVSDDYFSMYAGTSAAPQLVDLNKDGKLDIVMGRKNGTLAYFQNGGTVTVPSFTSTASIDSIGKFTVAESFLSGGIPYYFDGYSIPHVCDLDNDGKYEVLVGSDQGRVFLFRNFEANPNRVCESIDNIFSDGVGNAYAPLKFGYKTAVSTADLNNDGKPELIIGNTRGGIRLYQGTVSGIISGVQENLSMQSEWTLFPNPTQSTLHIRSSQFMSHQAYVISDMLGHEMQTGVMEGYEQELTLNKLPQGLYFIQTTNALGQSLVKKFVVE